MKGLLCTQELEVHSVTSLKRSGNKHSVGKLNSNGVDMQSKKHSFIESVTNIAIGYTVALATQLVVFPLVGVEASLSQNFMIGGYFTVVSLIRSYVIRRWFTKRTEK